MNIIKNKYIVSSTIIAMCFLLSNSFHSDAEVKTSTGSTLKETIVESTLSSIEENSVEQTNLMSVSLEQQFSQPLIESEIELQEQYKEDLLVAEAIAISEEEEAVYQENRNIFISNVNSSFNGALDGYEGYFYDIATSYGIDPYLAAAISILECGGGLSNLALNSYNFGGMRYNGEWLSYSSPEAGIEAYLGNLKRNYYDYGRNTAATIGPVYCGEADWPNKVMAIYYQLT